jgi:hypothetical protein
MDFGRVDLKFWELNCQKFNLALVSSSRGFCIFKDFQSWIIGKISGERIVDKIGP